MMVQCVSGRLTTKLMQQPEARLANICLAVGAVPSTAEFAVVDSYRPSPTTLFKSFVWTRQKV
jgi:hypothetical protein